VIATSGPATASPMGRMVSAKAITPAVMKSGPAHRPALERITPLEAGDDDQGQADEAQDGGDGAR